MDIVLQDQMGVMADIVLVLTQGTLTLYQEATVWCPSPHFCSRADSVLCLAFLFFSLPFAQLLGY